MPIQTINSIPNQIYAVFPFAPASVLVAIITLYILQTFFLSVVVQLETTMIYKSPDSDSRKMPSFLLQPSHYRSIPSIPPTASTLLLSVSHSCNIQGRTSLPRSYLFLFFLLVSSLCSPFWVSLALSAPTFVHSLQQQQQQSLEHSTLDFSISGFPIQHTSPSPPSLNFVSDTIEPEFKASAEEHQQLAKAHQQVKRNTPPQKNTVTSDIKHLTPSQTATKSSKSKPTMAPTPTTSSHSTSSIPTSVPSAITSSDMLEGSDNALFGQPSVVGSFNLTSGILIYGAFLLAFLVAIGVATIKRVRSRNQFHRDINNNSTKEAGQVPPGGKGSNGAKSSSKSKEAELREKDPAHDIQPMKQASISRRALTEDISPAGVPRRDNRTPDNNNNNRNRGDERGVRFGDSKLSSPIDRNGSMKRQQQPQSQPRSERARHEMNARFQGRDPELEYDSSLRFVEPEDSTDYSLPPLTASTTDNAYYSGGFSIQSDDYASPQMPKPAYQQQHQQQQPPRPLQPVKRAMSTRMPNSANAPTLQPKSLHRVPSKTINNRLERAGSDARPRIATQGLVERSGSSLSSRSNSSSGSNSSSPIDRYGRYGRGGSPLAQTEMDNYPKPIARSNSTRLPMEMRGGGAGGYDRSYAPSGLSRAQSARTYNYV